MIESSDIAVEAVDVSKIFGSSTDQVNALKSVCLQIPRNEFFTLLGPSGCGKTTLLRLIAGFEMPTNGEIRLDGEAIDKRPPYHRLVNTVFQNYALFPHKSVGENIAFGLKMRKVDAEEARTRVEEMLALVRLEGMVSRRPDQLSGGQQQRVALARALANRPKVLLLDEPLSALDYKLRKEMRLELKRLQRETGITFIFVTHDQEEALEMSDRIAVMSSGEVHQVGAPAEIYERPVNRFVADFIGESNFLDAEVLREEDGFLVCGIAGGGEFRASGSGPVGSEVTVAIRPEAAVVKPQGNGNGGLSGEVVDLVYQGSATTYHVRLDKGLILFGRAAESDSVAYRFSTGDQVALNIRPTGARVVQQ